MAIIFDGKRFASEIEKDLAARVIMLKKKKITPRLETILDGNNPASHLYVKLKKAAAERIGIELEIYPVPKKNKRTFINGIIRTLNTDKDVHGILLQLPVSETVKIYTNEFVRNISHKKDVDGLREKSYFTPATVSAVIKIINHAKAKTAVANKSNKEIKVTVYGAKGNIGKALVISLKKLKYNVIEIDQKTQSVKHSAEYTDSDIVISAVGKPNIVGGKSIKEGAIVIDVGSPRGDVSFNDVVGKASFITPVPGGVGPVTIVSLLENLVNAASQKVIK